ncbi:conserved protein of unknown function [Paraburkholderia dioscoreae]|uniref:Uncharacterized protein n=1 Tax=Paraburkholderia dioscoreae TaxID=2604047 RepID=A0A5Q4YSP0_9BURK|nr:conserved protein of unknown function [Paraburkholderia dioscoreae]
MGLWGGQKGMHRKIRCYAFFKYIFQIPAGRVDFHEHERPKAARATAKHDWVRHGCERSKAAKPQPNRNIPSFRRTQP